MVDEPPIMAKYLAAYSQNLLGALLVEPKRAHGEQVSKLRDDDCSASDTLWRVLAALRSRPAISVRDLVDVALKGKGCAGEVCLALDAAIAPYNAEFYAAQILRLQEARRKFWAANKLAYRLQLDLMREV